MTAQIHVHHCGPGVTVQDAGRPGYLAFGLSRGGAVDRIAIYEGAALLGQDPTFAAIEMAGIGGTFTATQDRRIALTGAPMTATMDGATLAWNASHPWPKSAQLTIGGVRAGSYGYLHIGGGVQAPERLGATSTHLAAGIGRALQSDDQVSTGPDPAPNRTGLTLPTDDRFNGGTVRIVESLQTHLFSADDIARFQATPFTRDTRGNRMGVRILPDGNGFQTKAGLSILSEVIVPGDIQIAGDGVPFVLLCECQTTGGYPRIGSVLPCDLPRIAQTSPGAKLRFQFMPLTEAVAIQSREDARLATLRRVTNPLLRNPADIPDLLSYQLISGAITGREKEQTP